MEKLISVSVEVRATKEQVWEAWTNPEHIVNWNFASADWHCPSAENDVRAGGKFSWRMEAKDGSMGFDFEGEYTDVVPLERLAYTLEDGRLVTVQIQNQGTLTLLTETFEAENIHAPELQKQGWQAILNNFKACAEAL